MPEARRAALAGALLPLLALLQSAAFLAPSAAGAGAETCAAVDSLGRLVDFFSHIDHVDADGYFGLSIASLAIRPARLITLTAIADECGESQAVELARTMAQLEHLTREFRSRFPLPAASGTNGYDSVTYWEVCRPLEAILKRRLWMRTFRWRRLKDGHQHHLRNSHASHGNLNSTETRLMLDFEKLADYNESFGDLCYREILKQERRGCSISPECRNFFLHSRYLFGYPMTHQFIYWLASVGKSCQEKLSDGTPVDQHLLDETCGRSYSEYTNILRSHSPKTDIIDLMTEHAVLCGIIGFRDFFADSTVLLLRRLQDERMGCFSSSKSSDAKMKSARTGGTAAAMSRAMKESKAIGRKLMHDLLLDGNCSSHTSGLATAYFALFLRP